MMFDSVNFIARYYEICNGVTFIGTQCICWQTQHGRGGEWCWHSRDDDDDYLCRWV